MNAKIVRDREGLLISFDSVGYARVSDLEKVLKNAKALEKSRARMCRKFEGVEIHIPHANRGAA